jgi:hypothetical protein
MNALLLHCHSLANRVENIVTELYELLSLIPTTHLSELGTELLLKRLVKEGQLIEVLQVGFYVI